MKDQENNIHLRITDVLRFFCGNQKAILKVASCKYVFWVACLFVVSAGLARNYDHHLLLEEPLWLGGPFFMVFFSSIFILALVGWMLRIPRQEKENMFGNYLAWARCFFLTAPLAWLYGIPYESMIDILPATIANFITLLIVSFWRVFLMVRVIQAVFKVKASLAAFAILIPTTLEMAVATAFKELSIVGIMGGMRLSPSDQFLLTATRTVSMGSWILFFVSLIGFLFLMIKGNIRGSAFKNEVRFTPSKNLWLSSIISILLWSSVSFPFQKTLKNQQTLRTLISESNFDQAAVFLKKKEPRDFPPGHDIFNRGSYPNIENLLELLTRNEKLPAWVIQRLVEDIKTADVFFKMYDEKDRYAPLLEKYQLQEN